MFLKTVSRPHIYGALFIFSTVLGMFLGTNTTFGAPERSRTSKGLLPHGSKPCAYTIPPQGHAKIISEKVKDDNLGMKILFPILYRQISSLL